MGWTAFQIACVAVFAAISLWIDPRDLNVLAGGLIIGIVVAFFVTGFVVHSQNLICRVRLWRARRRTVSQDGVHQASRETLPMGAALRASRSRLMAGEGALRIARARSSDLFPIRAVVTASFARLKWRVAAASFRLRRRRPKLQAPPSPGSPHCYKMSTSQAVPESQWRGARQAA